MDVTLHYVGLWLVGHLGPVADLTDVPEEEYALALAAANLYINSKIVRVS